MKRGIVASVLVLTVGCSPGVDPSSSSKANQILPKIATNLIQVDPCASGASVNRPTQAIVNPTSIPELKCLTCGPPPPPPTPPSPPPIPSLPAGAYAVPTTSNYVRATGATHYVNSPSSVVSGGNIIAFYNSKNAAIAHVSVGGTRIDNGIAWITVHAYPPGGIGDSYIRLSKGTVNGAVIPWMAIWTQGTWSPLMSMTATAALNAYQQSLPISSQEAIGMAFQAIQDLATVQGDAARATGPDGSRSDTESSNVCGSDFIAGLFFVDLTTCWDAASPAILGCIGATAIAGACWLVDMINDCGQTSSNPTVECFGEDEAGIWNDDDSSDADPDSADGQCPIPGTG